MTNAWPEQVYRRYSVDIHIPDWDPALLSAFDAAEYVGNIARSGAGSLLQYTTSHVGLCLWDTQIGHRHANMPPGRDFFGEVVSECRRQGVHPLAYFSLIFDNWNCEHHPDWRILPADGYTQLNGRYGTVCPNSPYREYVFACLREIVARYDIDGMFFDMTFLASRMLLPALHGALPGGGRPGAPAHRELGRLHMARVAGRAATLAARVRRRGHEYGEVDQADHGQPSVLHHFPQLDAGRAARDDRRV